MQRAEVEVDVELSVGRMCDLDLDVRPGCATLSRLCGVPGTHVHGRVVEDCDARPWNP